MEKILLDTDIFSEILKQKVVISASYKGDINVFQKNLKRTKS